MSNGGYALAGGLAGFGKALEWGAKEEISKATEADLIRLRAKALEARDANLAKLRHEYRGEELEQTSKLAGERDEASDTRRHQNRMAEIREAARLGGKKPTKRNVQMLETDDGKVPIEIHDDGTWSVMPQRTGAGVTGDGQVDWLSTLKAKMGMGQSRQQSAERSGQPGPSPQPTTQPRATTPAPTTSPQEQSTAQSGPMVITDEGTVPLMDWLGLPKSRPGRSAREGR